MADEKEFPLSLSTGGSSAPIAGGVEYSLQPCNQAGESPHKRKKAPTAVLNGCAPKRRGEEASGAVDSQLTVLEGEEGDDSDYEEFMVGLRASFAADIEKMIANSPFLMLTSTPRSDGQNDASKEDEEIGGAVVTTPVSG
jgi:hypothetical protein